MREEKLKSLNNWIAKLFDRIEIKMIKADDKTREYWIDVMSDIKEKQMKAASLAKKSDNAAAGSAKEKEADKALQQLEQAYLDLKEKVVEKPVARIRHLPTDNPPL